MYIRAKMDAYLDSSAGKLDTISAEPLRTWRVTGTDGALEAFRIAVGGTIVPDEEVLGIKDAAAVAIQVTAATAKVAVLQASLDTAIAELTDLQVVIPDIVPLKTGG